MQYFIGIVPPEDYKQKIVNFQKRSTSNQLPEVVEPHITVKAQGGLTEDLEWLSKIKEVCETFPAFELTLGEPKFFGHAVLFLSTDSKDVISLHKKLVAAIAPSQEIIDKYFELDLYTAHLTLAQTSWGISETELEVMRTQAEAALIPYPTFRISNIRIYHEIEPGRYQAFMDIPLVG